MRKPSEQDQKEPCFKSAHFSLESEPNPLQRKSYRNERRYLLPNPLTVRYNGDPDAVIVGTVEVFLVNDAGALFAQDMQDMLEGQKLKSFDEHNHATFSLLMRTISGDMNLRLKFVIRYRYKVPPRPTTTTTTGDNADESTTANRSDGVEYQEEFMSSPFRVESNRKKPLADHPCLLSLEPCEGPKNTIEEVCLKGSNFGDGKNLRVRFGGFPVAVVRADKDTITTVAPQRPDLPPNTRVPVQIGYSHPTRGVIWRSEALFYTYLGDKINDSSSVNPNVVKSSSCVLSSPTSEEITPAMSTTPLIHSGPSLNDLATAALVELTQKLNQGNEETSQA